LLEDQQPLEGSAEHHPAAEDEIISSLASGVTMGSLGFQIAQKYPVRVLREAVTNAVLHRAYHVARDIQVRIFDRRIEIESPGGFPGRVTVDNIARVGSYPRNRALVDHLREFPTPPNLDAGEGIPMMVRTMAEASLYPPLFLGPTELGRDAVLLVLLNEARPTVWDQVEHYLGEHGTIGNAEVRTLMRTDDRVRASKQLSAWVKAGLLVVVDPDASKSQRRYRKPGVPGEALLFPDPKEIDPSSGAKGL